MSPAAFTSAPEIRSDASASSARCAAHPFTRPVGSTPPGMAHGSNHPWEISRAVRQSAKTSATGAGASSSGDLAPAEPTQGAVVLPGAEDLVGMVEDGPGPGEGLVLDPRPIVAAVDVDGHHGPHDLLLVVPVPATTPSAALHRH